MITLSYKPYTLQFNFDARTSRGVISQKTCYIVTLTDSETGQSGRGEVAPLQGLSPEYATAENLLKQLSGKNYETVEELLLAIPEGYSSVLFGIETAILDAANGGKYLIYNNAFVQGTPIAINGLVWMADAATMRKEIIKKINDGFSTIKLKIGAIDFEQEMDLLRFVRKEFAAEKLSLRVDANGAFAPSEALEKLKRISEYAVHSIEQPIATGQWEQLAALCSNTPVPIALDEELINNTGQKEQLFDAVKPQYIILKPSLMGGLAHSKAWIAAAEKRTIGWWMTSALESNIGLNAIAQFTANYTLTLPQGLGTGALYTNNIASPLEVKNGELRYNRELSWSEPS